jgi:hypothetical protein
MFFKENQHAEACASETPYEYFLLVYRIIDFLPGVGKGVIVQTERTAFSLLAFSCQSHKLLARPIIVPPLEV